MLGNVSNVTAVSMIDPASCANTAAATSGWIDVRAAKGPILIIQQSGAITGTLDGKLQHATSSGGAGAADITGAVFTQVDAANKVETLNFVATTGPYIKYIGTVGTGPVVLGVTCIYSSGQAG